MWPLIKSRRQGFTVVELLVTIAIIGVLLSIILANFQKARDQADDDELLTTLKQASFTAEKYRSENGRYPSSISEIDYSSSCVFNYFVDGSGTTYRITADSCIKAKTVSPDNEYSRCPSICPQTGNCDPTSSNFKKSYGVYKGPSTDVLCD